MQKKWSLAGKRIGLAFGAIVVVALAVTAWSSPTHTSTAYVAGVQSASTPADPSAAALVTQAGVAMTAAQVYASFPSSLAVAGNAIDLSSFTPASTIASEVITLFQQVSSQPTFTALYDSVGSGGFAYGFGNNMATGISNVYFEFNVVEVDQTSTVSWDGNLSSMTLSGPVVVERPTVSMNTVFDSTSWAGSSWWQSGSPTLTDTGFDEKYPSMTEVTNDPPQHVPSGDSVGQVASVWVGLTNSSNYLLQTGAYTDVSAGQTEGQLFYELACPSGDYCPSGSYSFPPGLYPDDLTEVPVGDYAYNAIWEGSNSSDWNLEVYDWSSGGYATVNWYIGEYVGARGYSPQWTQYIVEAPTLDGIIQQLPDFGEVIVGDDYYGTCGSCESGWHSYSHSYNQYQLEQEASNDNTDQGYENVDCGYHGTYGCPTVTWENSNYNYAYIY
jgi:hypothetical protein